MSNQLVDLYTKEALVKILKIWYPSDNIIPNERVALKVYQLLIESRKCTSSLNKITPLLGGPFGTARTLTMPAIKAIKDTIKKASNDEHMLACIKQMAWYHRSAMLDLGSM